MLKVLPLLFFLTFSTAYAANPKIFSGVGDPVYDTVSPLEKLQKLKIFKPERGAMLNYINEARAAKKEGFAIDRAAGSAAAKPKINAYLQTLRRLEKENGRLANVVKEQTRLAIKKKSAPTFYAIKNSRHPVLTDNRSLRAEIAVYERRLKQEAKKRRLENYRYYRTADNLGGSWVSRGNGAVTTLTFRKNGLTMQRQSADEELLMRGDWRIEKEFLIFTVTTVERQEKERPKHVRRSAVSVYYKIVNVDTHTLELRDEYGEIISVRKEQ